MATTYCKIAIFLVLLGIFGNAYSESVWTFRCMNQKYCERTLIRDLPEGIDPLGEAVCKLNCNPTEGSLFPLPTGQVALGPSRTPFYTGKLTISGYEAYPVGVRDLFVSAASIFTNYLEEMRPSVNETNPDFQNNLVVFVRASDVLTTVLTMDTDESYNLTVSLSPDNQTVTATVSGVTFFGARHGLETLSQLIAYDERNDVLQVVNNALIYDKPAYRYRGVTLDTSRNFISIKNIQRVIDGLSYNKMNIFHWHLTNSHSFPMQVAGMPQFTDYGAYSEKKIYTLQDMQRMVDYARPRGVTIVPEFEGPAHAGFGWEWGPSAGLGNLVVCLNDNPWYEHCLQPPCGQLNVVNDAMYELLGTIYSSMFSIFDNGLFHMGGEEVYLKCYNDTREITDWMEAAGVARDVDGFMYLLGYYQQKAYEKVLAASGNPATTGIIWSSELTHKKYRELYLTPENYIIQIWDPTLDENMPDIINSGYRVIVSNSDRVYLDCGFPQHAGQGLNWCSPYKGWHEIYDHNPYEIYANATNSTMADEAMERGLLLGASTPLFTEMVDDQAVQSRIWPRAAAMAERLWTNPSGNWQAGEFRMVTNRNRMVFRGIACDRMKPEFCSLYQNGCYGEGSWDGKL